MSPSNSSNSGFVQRIKRMCTKFPVKDTRYLTAIFFLLGAIFFTINGFLYVFQTTQPKMYFRPLAVPVSSCIGDFFFFLGCTLAIFEAMNAKKAKLDGLGVAELDLESATPEEKHQKGGLESGVMEREKPVGSPADSVSTPAAAASQTVFIGDANYTWIPSTKHFRDVAFIASIIWFIGIIFFTIATIAYVPGVADLTNVNTYYYLALLPTFLGGFFFLVAALMNMMLSQRKWYLPAVTRLSWYVGFWYSVGSLGFALGGCLWYAGEPVYWAATLASFWGAWGWVIGSALRWYVIMGDY